MVDDLYEKTLKDATDRWSPGVITERQAPQSRGPSEKPGRLSDIVDPRQDTMYMVITPDGGRSGLSATGRKEDVPGRSALPVRSAASLIGRALHTCRKTLSEVAYGLTGYELELECRKERGSLNNLLMLMMFGDLAGLLVFPPYYSMRLLPYIVPSYRMWRRNLLRERDITDTLSGDI